MKLTPVNIRKLLSRTALFAVFLVVSSQAHSIVLPSFANGGFEGYTGNTNVHNSDVPPGWTTTGGTPDTFDENTNIYSYKWGPSSTGGDFLHGIGWQPTWTESAVQNALSGLVIGQQYEISFEQAISNSTITDTGGFWRITFGTEVHDSPLMTLPALGVFEGWTWHTMLFTATSETQSLAVSAISDTNGVRTDIGIDSFYLGTPGGNPNNPNNPNNPTNVPEPASIALFGLGLLGMSMRRRQKSK